MVNSVGSFPCMGFSLSGSKSGTVLKCSYIKNAKYIQKKANNDGKTQITTAAPKVRSWPQEANGGS